MLYDVADKVIKENGVPVTVQYISDIELGKRNPKNAYIIKALADALSLDEDWLFYLTGQFPIQYHPFSMRETDFKRGMKAFVEAVND
jgi:transcriptional regulator with XRE-family HTH domain